MAHYSVATTRDNLSSLINKALAGEEVVITRHGKPAVFISMVEPMVPPRDEADDAMVVLAQKRQARAKRGIVANNLMQEIRGEYRY